MLLPGYFARWLFSFWYLLQTSPPSPIFNLRYPPEFKPITSRRVNFRAPKPLPILSPSNFVPQNGFPVVQGLRAIDKIQGLFTGHDPTRGSGQVGLKSLAGRVGSGHDVLKYHGSGRVGSTGFKISRVGSGRVGSIGFKISRVGSGRAKKFQNLAGRVGLSQEVFKNSRVGSGHDPRDTGHSRVKPS